MSALSPGDPAPGEAAAVAPRPARPRASCCRQACGPRRRGGLRRALRRHVAPALRPRAARRARPGAVRGGHPGGLPRHLAHAAPASTPTGAAPCSWMMTIAHRKAVDRVRSAEAAEPARHSLRGHATQDVDYDITAEAASTAASRPSGCATGPGHPHRDPARGRGAGLLRRLHAHRGRRPAGPPARHRQDPNPRRTDPSARHLGSAAMNADIHGLVGAYAVDALDDVERAQFERAPRQLRRLPRRGREPAGGRRRAHPAASADAAPPACCGVAAARHLHGAPAAPRRRRAGRPPATTGPGRTPRRPRTRPCAHRRGGRPDDPARARRPAATPSPGWRPLPPPPRWPSAAWSGARGTTSHRARRRRVRRAGPAGQATPSA